MTINREHLAWASGFWEGEGYIGAGYASKKHHKPTVTFQLTQVNPEPLRSFQEIFPYLKIFGPKKQISPKQADVYVISSRNFEHIQATCAMLWPWLSAKRKAQVSKALKAVAQ